MMKSIDETRLENDVEYRFRYLAEFIGFGEEDVAAIHESAMYLGPLVPELVEKTYEKLLSYDATARHFLPRQHGYEGALPVNLAALSQQTAQVRFRKDHLTRYFLHLLGRAYDAKMAVYLDMAGKIHTAKAGNDEIQVPLVQMNALMGLLADTLTVTITRLGLDPEATVRTLRAFQKLLWIQNDLINRHYQAESDAAPAKPALTNGTGRAYK